MWKRERQRVEAMGDTRVGDEQKTCVPDSRSPRGDVAVQESKTQDNTFSICPDF